MDLITALARAVADGMPITDDEARGVIFDHLDQQLIAAELQRAEAAGDTDRAKELREERRQRFGDDDRGPTVDDRQDDDGDAGGKLEGPDPEPDTGASGDKSDASDAKTTAAARARNKGR